MSSPLSHYFTCISGLVAEYIVAIDVTRAQFPADAWRRLVLVIGTSTGLARTTPLLRSCTIPVTHEGGVAGSSAGWSLLSSHLTCISGLVAEYIVAIDVTRARFPADAWQRP